MSGGAAAFGQAAAPRGPSPRVGLDDLVDLADQLPAGRLVAFFAGQQPVLVDRHLQFRPGAAEGDPAVVCMNTLFRPASTTVVAARTAVIQAVAFSAAATVVVAVMSSSRSSMAP